GTPGRSASADRIAGVRFTAAERKAIFEHAEQYAAVATEHIRWCAVNDPARAADAAHAAAGALHVAPAPPPRKGLRGAAGCYDPPWRMPFGRVPGQTHEGRQLRAAARLLALTGSSSQDGVQQLAGLVAQLAALALAVAELRRAQRHAAQAAAAQAAATRLQALPAQAGPAATWYARPRALLTRPPGQNHRNARARAQPSRGQPPVHGASRSPPPPRTARRPAGR